MPHDDEREAEVRSLGNMLGNPLARGHMTSQQIVRAADLLDEYADALHRQGQISEAMVQRAARAAYIQFYDAAGFDAEAAWADMAFPADEWSAEAMDWFFIARAALEAAEEARR